MDQIKKIFLTSALLVIGMESALAMANPASVFCKNMGGTTEIVKQANGSEIGLCRLQNGNIFEEWTLFRLFNGKENQ